MESVGWRAEGPAKFLGSEARFGFRTPDRRAFERNLEGILSERVVFDGVHGRSWDMNGASRRLELFDLESPVLAATVLMGSWMSFEGSAGFLETEGDAAVLAPESSRPLVLGRLAGRLALDGATGFPVSLEYPSVAGLVSWRFDGHREHAGVVAPRRVTQSIAGEVALEFEMEDVAPFSEPLELPEALDDPADYTLDPAASPRLDVRRGPFGHLLVAVRVADGEPEWWILDSGASGSTIGPRSAARAGLAEIGSAMVRSVLGSTRCPIRRAGRIAVGPLVLHDLRLVEFDLGPFGDVFGVPVGGVLGFDVFRRAVVSVEPATDEVRLLRAGGLAPVGATRDGRGGALRLEPLTIHLGHPVISGTLEGYSARFRLDLGMGGDGVIVHRLAARRLLGGRRTEPAHLGSAEARSGRVSSLAFAGSERFDVDAVFALGAGGPFDDPHVDATLGIGMLNGYRVQLDYAGGQIAFANIADADAFRER